jgi:DNA-binding MarR family transcriptional regulator
MPRGGRSAGTPRPRTTPIRDPHDILTQQLDLPMENQRTPIHTPDRTYQLRHSEVQMLAAIGAFRVVDVNDFRANDRWHGDVDHLRQEGLIDVVPRTLDGRQATVLTLTTQGRELLAQNQRALPPASRQAFYAGIVKPRELAHDVRVYRAYAAAVARLTPRGANVRRVVLDYELKREYQRFLQANNRTHRRSSGRPDQSETEIREWAAAHHLAVVDQHVQFPDVRIEYERPDGRLEREDVEVTTANYSGRQMAGKSAAGFTMHASQAGRLGGAKRGGSPFDPHVAAKLLR